MNERFFLCEQAILFASSNIISLNLSCFAGDISASNTLDSVKEKFEKKLLVTKKECWSDPTMN